MGDFNRRGTPVSKIMSYDRYNMKKMVATLGCRDKINFNVYFRVNISDGQIYDDFLLLTLPQQISILKKFRPAYLSLVYLYSYNAIGGQSS